jgi:glucose/arabinose dehydrogenase
MPTQTLNGWDHHTLTHKLQFPAKYSGDAFASEHGSWKRDRRARYEAVVVPMKDGRATGEYDDFLAGLVIKDGQVWGRTVKVTVGGDDGA